MRMLKVLANPYLAVDHNGRLCGACPTHSVAEGHTPNRREFVGVKLSRERTKIISQGDPVSLAYHEQDTYWDHSVDVVEVPATADHYYLQRLVHGDIIAADKATATYAGLKFEEPSIVFARLRKEAIAKWVAMYGEEPAFASGPCPMTPVKAKSIAPIPSAPSQAGSQ